MIENNNINGNIENNLPDKKKIKTIFMKKNNLK